MTDQNKRNEQGSGLPKRKPGESIINRDSGKRDERDAKPEHKDRHKRDGGK